MTKKDKNKTSYSKDLRKEKPFSEKYKLTVIKQKMYTIFFLTFPLIIFCMIMAIISQKWEIFAMQTMCYLWFICSLYRLYAPPKVQIGGTPYLLCACIAALCTILLTQFYF